MSATSINVAAKPVDIGRLVSPSVLLRLALSAAAVLLCYQFGWMWLRSFTCTWNLRLDALFGVHLQRIAQDLVTYRGVTYRYAVACTFADAFCGSIPLIWDLGQKVWRSLLLVAGLAVVLTVLNIVRLTFSDVLFAQGLSWDWAHNIVSGISYFIFWEWILSRGVLRRRAA